MHRVGTQGQGLICVRLPLILASGRRKQLTRRKTSQERAVSEKLMVSQKSWWSTAQATGKWGRDWVCSSRQDELCKVLKRRGQGQHLSQRGRGEWQGQLELAHPLSWLPVQINRAGSTYFPHLGTCKASAQRRFWKQDAISGKNVPSKGNKHETDRMLCSINTNHRLF